MKLKGLYKMALIIMGIMVISLVGCGPNKDKAEETPVEEITKTPEDEESIESDVSGEGDKDTGEFADEEVLQTAPEDIGGEGMTDGTMPDLTGMEESLVGEPVMFTDEKGTELCLFAIESVESSEMQIENMGDIAGKKVVVVSYSYTNMSAEGNLLFDDMSFKMLANDTVCTPYFSPKLTPAASSGVGETAFGQVAFLSDESCKDVIVVFDNASVNAKTIFKTTIK